MSEQRNWFQVLEGVERGERAAVDAIDQVIRGYLARFGAYGVQDSWDDICQETLVQLLRSFRRGALRDERAFVAYVGRVTRSRLLNWVERKCKHDRREVRSESPSEHGARAATQPAGGPTLRTRIALREALQKLPGRTRRVLEAIYLEGLSYAEAAQRLGLALGTLKRIQTQGLREMRGVLNVATMSPQPV